MFLDQPQYPVSKSAGLQNEFSVVGRNFLQNLLIMNFIIADNYAGYDGFTPSVLKINFSSRNIKLAVQAGKERLEPAAFVLQRSAVGQEQVQG